MTTLSKSFRSLASQKFEFLVRDFGFGPPEVRSQGWQFTELLYRGKRVAIRVSLDNEEQVLVYVHLMTDGIMPPRDDVSRTFLVDAVAPIWSDRAPKWGFISTEPELERVLGDYASATRIRMPELLRTESAQEDVRRDRPTGTIR